MKLSELSEYCWAPIRMRIPHWYGYGSNLITEVLNDEEGEVPSIFGDIEVNLFDTVNPRFNDGSIMVEPIPNSLTKEQESAVMEYAANRDYGAWN